MCLSLNSYHFALTYIFKYDGISRFHSARICSDGTWLLVQWCDPQSPKLIIRASESEICVFFPVSDAPLPCGHGVRVTMIQPPLPPLALDFRAQAPVYDTKHLIRPVYPTSYDLVLQFQLLVHELNAYRKPTLLSNFIYPSRELLFDYPHTTTRTYAIYPPNLTRQTARRSLYQ